MSEPKTYQDGLNDMLCAVTSTGAERLVDAVEEAAEVRPDLFDGLDRTVV